MDVRSFFLLFMTLGLLSCGGGEPAPIVVYGQSSGAGSAGAHTVHRGDTLYSISSRYRLSMRDIAVVNRLQPPFRLHEGQRLILPPPNEYKVRTGDTLYGVSRMFSVSSNDVARLNDLQSPYVLRTGQVLRLPSASNKAKAAAVSSAQTKNTPAVKVASVDKEVLVAPKSEGGEVAISPSSKPVIQSTASSQPTQIKDGVPMPKAKPQAYEKPKEVKVSKVTTKPIKRSSSKFLQPVQGKVISNYGAKKSGLHNDGINIAAARGTSVSAAENGVVVYAGNALKGSGNLVLVRHDGQWMTAYAHLDSIGVREGQRVSRGQNIGKVGSTGAVSSPQLHFEIRRGTAAMNPVKYMD